MYMAEDEEQYFTDRRTDRFFDQYEDFTGFRFQGVYMETELHLTEDLHNDFVGMTVFFDPPALGAENYDEHSVTFTFPLIFFEAHYAQIYQMVLDWSQNHINECVAVKAPVLDGVHE